MSAKKGSADQFSVTLAKVRRQNLCSNAKKQQNQQIQIDSPATINKNTNMSNLPKNNNEVMNKTMSKNKASMELHTESQNAKKNANKHTNNCVQPIPKHCGKRKVKQTKKMHY